MSEPRTIAQLLAGLGYPPPGNDLDETLRTALAQLSEARAVLRIAVADALCLFCDRGYDDLNHLVHAPDCRLDKALGRGDP